MRRTVVTGIGVVSPLGVGVDFCWKKLMDGNSGIVSTAKFGDEFHNRLKTGVLGLVPTGSDPGYFDHDDPRINKKSFSNFIRYAIVAADEALHDAGWTNLTQEQQDYTGVSIGNGIGALDIIESRICKAASLPKEDKILSAFGPFFIPSVLPSLGAGYVSMTFGLRGPNRSINAACASGLYSIEDAASMIRNGDAKVVVTGSSESTICPAAIGGFDAMTALSRKYNDTPSRASRPYDKGRDGFVLSEGAGILILEDMEHAIQRGARIHAEYICSGLTSDAYHVSAPSGSGSERAIRLALKRAGLAPQDIGYIGTHATSTGLGDRSEVEAMMRVFGEHLPSIKFSAVKSSIGHSLGGASGVESVFLVKSLVEQMVPPTINVEDPDDFVLGLDYVPHPNTAHSFKYAMKNSFGFGGTNACSIFATL